MILLYPLFCILTWRWLLASVQYEIELREPAQVLEFKGRG